MYSAYTCSLPTALVCYIKCSNFLLNPRYTDYPLSYNKDTTNKHRYFHSTYCLLLLLKCILRRTIPITNPITPTPMAITHDVSVDVLDNKPSTKIAAIFLPP